MDQHGIAPEPVASLLPGNTPRQEIHLIHQYPAPAADKESAARTASPPAKVKAAGNAGNGG
ncbi:hypothetical [Yersinia pestis KIM10+]|uniref:Uncharacterized protein n=1 Tax=Yersinia pestis TaxID=632 RepID=Q8CK99_YERPE|nr:hypothetical [Yersinia pestis KIM10+]